MANYRMRSYNTVLGYHVYWVAPGAPDFSGSGSGYPPIQLVDIIVNNVIFVGGVTPGEGGGDWEFPPMSEEPYDPLPVDMISTFDPYYQLGDLVTTELAPMATTLATQTSPIGTQPLSDLMALFP